MSAMNIALFPLVVVLLLLDFLITLITFGWVKALKKMLQKSKMRSVPVADDPSHRVQEEHRGNLIATPSMGINTLYQLQQYGFSLRPNAVSMEVREYLGQHSPKIKKFGEVKKITFKEVEEKVNKFGAALAANGLVAADKTPSLEKRKTPSSLAIFEETCPEWLISSLGSFSQSIIVTTIYATLGIDAVFEAINDGSIRAIVCNKKSVASILKQISRVPTLKVIIYTDFMVAPDESIDIPAAPRGVKVMAFDDFVASGDVLAYPPRPPTQDMIAVVMYTSGSTGKPKGVIILHKQMLAAIAAAEVFLAVGDDERYLGYLPLAHIMELMAEVTMIGRGLTICYADPKTLTVTGAYPIGALEQYSPTMMAGVPKVWEVIKKTAEAKLTKYPASVRYIAGWVFKARHFALTHGYDTPLFYYLFKRIKRLVGGKLTRALSGGGPLNGEAHEFCRTAFGLTLVQGYGLTETCAGLVVQDLEDYRFGIAGMPIASCEVKLLSASKVVDRDGFPYLSTDRVDVDGRPVWGRGEVLVKGGNVGLGYYMMPEKTKEVFLEDGFFRTGDIGQFEPDGSLKLVDRVKNIVKLKGGEYVAIEKMEMAYANSKFVDSLAGGVCVFADGDMDRPVIFVQLNEVATTFWAKENKIDMDFETLKASELLNKVVLDDMKTEAKKSRLTRIEVIAALEFMSDHWTPENGCLTAANKLDRRKITSVNEKAYKELKQKGIF